jgi:hypothetical protein
VLLLGMVLALASCSGGDGAERAAAPVATARAATTAPATTATTGSSQADVKAAVLAAYRAHWADIVVVGKTADWRSPRLAAHTTGQALQKLRSHFRNLKQFGLIDLGTVQVNPKVVAVRSRTAIVEDCVDVSRFLLHDAKTRQPREKPDPRPDAGVATLTLTADGWKVATTVGRGECAG